MCRRRFSLKVNTKRYRTDPIIRKLPIKIAFKIGTSWIEFSVYFQLSAGRKYMLELYPNCVMDCRRESAVARFFLHFHLVSKIEKKGREKIFLSPKAPCFKELS